MAFDYALQLSERGHMPIIFTKGKIRCLPILRERAKRKGIRYMERCCPKRVRESGKRIEVLCSSGRLMADCMLVATGRKRHYPRIMTASRKGLHFAGAARDRRYRYAHIAAGDALRAAANVIHASLHPPLL